MAFASHLHLTQRLPHVHQAHPRLQSGVGLVLSTLLLYTLIRAVVGLGHELTTAGLATLLRLLLGSNAWEPLVRTFGLDPIYTGAAVHAAGGVEVVGFAIAGPLGAFLHATLPGIFLPPHQVAAGAGASMVAAPGAPALGRGLASFGTDVVWLALGVWLFTRWRHRSARLSLLGLLIQAQVCVNHLLNARMSLADLDASGIPFALQVAIPAAGWFTGGLATWPAEARSIVLGVTLVALAYGCVASAFLVARLVVHRRAAPLVRTLPRRTTLVGVAVALVTAASPVGALARGEANWQTQSGHAVASLPVPVESSPPVQTSGATPVSVHQAPDGSWQYVVDGTPEVIRGVGYNPWYASLDPAQRTATYDRDFAAMRELGINTIEGWFETQFDQVTLDAAQRNGIGVLMPFELNQDWDYTDPNVRASILDRLSAYVEQYKDHPAVRMWAPGNENLHRILYAHMVSQANVPAARARAEAFAAFLPVLVDRIHALDPNHPVVYRDAEDLYLSWITNGFAQAGGERPWLVYGANVYSAARLHDIVSRWPGQWPGRPLLISEFAPGGAGPLERPLGFQQEWQLIRSRPDEVLGGMAYTWSTSGPEDLDRVFGLVDPNGVPSDGALTALSTAYLADSAVARSSP